MKPNIFNFATKELSQDAFLCYLLEFSKEEYKKYEKEHIFANIFLKNILNKFSPCSKPIPSISAPRHHA